MPRRLRKLATLPATERLLLLETAALLAGVRLGLWLLPFGALRRLLARFAQPARSACSSPSQVAWAVTLASRCIPKATCLTQALAAQALLARRGHPAQIHIGVASNDGSLDAHAWVESQDGVVIQGAQLDRYTSVVTLER